MTPLQNDLKEFIELLNFKEVEYLVVGGFAVAFHEPSETAPTWLGTLRNRWGMYR